MKRYQIYTIAARRTREHASATGMWSLRGSGHASGNADCMELGDGPLAEADSMTDADRLAAEHSRHAYGAAILDTETFSINWGMGWEQASMINKMNPAAAAEVMKDGGLTYGAGYVQLHKHAISCASATARTDPEISQWWRQVAECCWTKMSNDQRDTAWCGRCSR